MTVDLCVVNYNTLSLMQRMLDCLHSDNVEKKWQLWIADNASTDGSIEWLKQHASSYKTNGIYFNDNIGYSAACNSLAAQGTGEIIALLNADVWFPSQVINDVINVFEDNPDIHILGPKQRDEDNRIVHAGIVGTNQVTQHRGWRELDPDDVLYRDRVPCVTVSGSAYFIRRSVWDALTNHPSYQALYPNAVGAFLPTPHYYEETWCSFFARHLGFNVVYEGSISIGHTWHASSVKPSLGGTETSIKSKISREIFNNACDAVGVERAV